MAAKPCALNGRLEKASTMYQNYITKRVFFYGMREWIFTCTHHLVD